MDISEENRLYAMQTASAAGVELNYICSDGKNGRFILTDFHPFARAWMNTYNLKQPTGNYFDDSIKEEKLPLLSCCLKRNALD
ncbi:hypothetical protein [Paenibacillus sonchi]|uniref:hypothetical protein n=1 Tax=Paenibacillus sonchi TaxID=373687 RepID=UPI001F3D603B|nr:hypothetical protein [Paenibacillus sonchi]